MVLKHIASFSSDFGSNDIVFTMRQLLTLELNVNQIKCQPGVNRRRDSWLRSSLGELIGEYIATKQDIQPTL